LRSKHLYAVKGQALPIVRVESY